MDTFTQIPSLYPKAKNSENNSNLSIFWNRVCPIQNFHFTNQIHLGWSEQVEAHANLKLRLPILCQGIAFKMHKGHKAPCISLLLYKGGHNRPPL